MPTSRYKTIKTVAAVFAVAFAARVAVTLCHGYAPLLAEMNAYWDAARRLLAGEGFHAGHGFRAFIPPGYVWFLTLIRALGGDTLWARLAQAPLGALTAVAAFFYGRRPLGDRAAAAAAFIFALWPASLVMGDFLLTESLFTLLFVAGLAVWADGASWRRAGLAGVLWGAAALTREQALYFFPFITICYFLIKRCKVAIKALVASLIVAACVAPWTVRNYVVLGGLVPVTTKSAVDFYIYNHNNLEQIINNESDAASENALFADAGGELELYKSARGRALAWIAAHPALFLVKGLRTEMNFVGLERDFFQHQLYGYYDRLSMPATVLLALLLLGPSAAALPLAFAGAIRFGGDEHLRAGVFVMILYVIITFVAYSFTRQRYPLTPLIITFAVAAGRKPRETRAWLKSRRPAFAAFVAFNVFLAAAWALELYQDFGDYFRY
jgi:4-amino-4-deoxy-L-arabinose transferase-like glycosyltransferase